jgi:hypothetical protein
MLNLLNYIWSGKVLCGKTRFMKLYTLLGYLLCGFDSFCFLTLFKLAKFYLRMPTISLPLPTFQDLLAFGANYTASPGFHAHPVATTSTLPPVPTPTLVTSTPSPVAKVGRCDSSLSEVGRGFPLRQMNRSGVVCIPLPTHDR